MEEYLQELLKVREILKTEGPHLKIPNTMGKLVVVGDLHGDGRTLRLLENYLFKNDDYIMVYLGDFVDRTPSSWDDKQSYVVIKLLKLKIIYPDRIYMLMGNHDADPLKYVNFYSEFWHDLSDTEHEFFSDVLSTLPIVATTSNGVALCHGVLPPDNNFCDFDLHTKKWQDVLWADYQEDNGFISNTCRPTKYKKDFIKSMAAFDASLLIKGHNPFAPITMYDNKCVTIQTTRVYADLCGMHIVILDLEKPVKDASDVKIINLNNIL